MAHSPDQLIRFLDGFERRRILVVGDFMLDHYVHGDAQRLSPDAPVPVLAVRDESYAPGGAGNVCLDLAALNLEVRCVGVVGADPAAERLRESLRAAGCDVGGLLEVADRPTTQKQNVVGLAQHRHPQKMFRIDRERNDDLARADEHRLLETVRAGVAEADLVCLEDYRKGVLSAAACREIIAVARDAGVEVLVDPAAIDCFDRYARATCLTPNRTEAARATGRSPGEAASRDAEEEAMAEQMLEALELDAVVLTLDKQGALLRERAAPPLRIPTVARQIYDVTGAGDMVLAMLAAARANGADWPMAVQLANVAAGLEVERFGVQPVSLDEILVYLFEHRRETAGKLRALSRLRPELETLKRAGKRVAFTNGCFDILHAGHVSYLRSAAGQGDVLVLGVNSDESIRRIKGPDRPVNREADRLMVLSELQSVDYLVLFDEDTPMTLLDELRPDVLVKGADYSREQVVGGDFVESCGGEVAIVDLVDGLSTTGIIGRIRGR